jgi:Uma2 family endonuclease
MPLDVRPGGAEAERPLDNLGVDVAGGCDQGSGRAVSRVTSVEVATGIDARERHGEISIGSVPIAPHPGPTTWDDIQAMPEDGRRYESFAGVLTVTPSPNGRHQRAAGRLYLLLYNAAPRDLEVLPAPYGWWISEIEWYEPDVVVFDRADFDPAGPLRATPLIVVEVSSPSTRLHDLNAKFAAYATNGCPHYWVVDPDEPSVVAFRLAGGRYEEVSRVVGDERFDASKPFAVAFSPSALIAD